MPDTKSHNGSDSNEERSFDSSILLRYYPSILQTAGIGVWVINRALQTVYVNECMSALLGSSITEMLQKPVKNFVHQDGNEDDNFLSRLQENRDVASYHGRFKLPSGAERWIKMSITTMYANGERDGSSYFLVLHTDTKSQPVTENQATGMPDHRIIESLKDYAVMTVDTNRIISSWNTGAARIFGYTDKEIIGKSADILFTPEDISDHAPEQEVKTALKIGHSYDDRWHVRKDGSRFFASGIMTRLDNDANSAKLVKIARDWTERKKTEETLKIADRHKNEFLATLAHELRNPLASILSGIEVLKENKDKTIVVKTQEIIERQVQQMIHLVNDLLDISRISLGKIKLKKETINLIDTIHLALETSRPIIEGYKHALTISLPPGPIAVNGDTVRLSQVFLNLLINSAKYNPQKGKITLIVYPENNDVVIKITDNGMGIPPQMLSSIFQMFEQIQNRSEYPQAGLGIGLSVVKQLVEMHGGTVEAYSAGTNKGSEFVVKLPTVQDETTYQLTESLLGIPIKKEIKLIRKRLLLVDDNTDAADMMEILLAKKGYIIKKAYDGKTAIKIAPDFNPEIVLLDLGLPDISGYEVLNSLKKILGQRHYIALSGWGQEEDLQRSKQAGFDHHLVKPLDIQSLEEILRGMS